MSRRLTLLPLPSLFFSVPGSMHSRNDDRSTVRIATKMLFPARPVRLVVPSSFAESFSLVGVDIETAVWESVKVPGWDRSSGVPCVIFSELYRPLEFDMMLPELRTGDAIVAHIFNTSPAARNFAGGWLVESLVDE